MRDKLYWSSRILSVLFVLFISFFATSEKTVIGFLIQLIPALIVLAFTLLAWRWERIGGILFYVLGFLYILFAWGYTSPLAYVIISGPMFLLGTLFLIQAKRRNDDRRIRSRDENKTTARESSPEEQSI
ncbi:MAG TPA: hypothetical protein VJB91_00135 [Patescibacteria group bacterium]|nr:hypothetical protein [Patescibacteria group bacterium]